MNKSEIGMFYRYKGQIGKYKKITELDRYPSFTNNYLREAELILLNNAKFSFNIIDLIEVGDYVNGEIVTKISLDNIECNYIEIGYTYNRRGLRNKDIKSIVTREQFSALEYRLGDK